MRNLLLTVLCLINVFRVIHTQYSINTNAWDSYSSEKLDPGITIGDLKYNFFDKSTKELCVDSCNKNNDNSNISYPSGYDYPQIAIFDTDNIKTNTPTSKHLGKERADQVNAAINDNTPGKKFYLDYSLGWGISDVDSLLGQAVLAWNSNDTYLIIIFVKPYDVSLANVKLGRGLGKYYLKNYIPQQRMSIYDISSRRVTRINCLPTNDVQTNKVYPFWMNSTYLSNMGGETVILQGPCSNDLNNQILYIFNKAGNQVSMIGLQRKTTQMYVYSFVVPALWHPGLYTFKFKYSLYTFEMDVEIYNVFESDIATRLLWINREQMNDPNFNSKTITLYTNGLAGKIQFNVLDLVTQENTIVNRTMNAECIGENQNCSISVKDLASLSFDHNKEVGFFTIQAADKVYYSSLFSLIWLQAYKASVDDKQKFTSAACSSFLSKNNRQPDAYCPESSEKAKYLFSTYSADYYSNFSIAFQIPELKENNCYIQMADRISKSGSRGVTCCYDNKDKLSYGQDFYLRNNALTGSYAWTHSPITDSFKHFFYDRMPMMSCCLLVKDENLCQAYWVLSNNVRISNDNFDYAGFVFGDPHFVPFNSKLPYSFLSRGEYWLIHGPTDFFNLQGRFYSEAPSNSLLTGIAFSANSNKVMISTKRNSSISLDWGISVNNIFITLPFADQGITAIQTKDTKTLYVYIRIAEEHYALLVINRLTITQKFEEYLNLKLFMSNSFGDKVDGGLFGKIDRDTYKPILQSRNETKTIELNANDLDYFIFGKSWQLNNKIESYFSYVSEHEHGLLNSEENYTMIANTSASECDNVKFCNIDKELYKTANIWQATKDTYIESKEYNLMVKTIKYGTNQMCDHPQWNYTRLDSTSFNNGSTINIVGCTDKDVTIEKIKLQCGGIPLTWTATPPIIKEICKLPITPSPSGGDNGNSYIAIYIAVPLVAILVVVVLVVGFIIFNKRRNAKSPIKMKSEISATSQDALHPPVSIPMDDTYDTWQGGAAEENDYGVYSQIKKP